MQIVPVQHPQIVGGLPGIANTYQTHGKAGKKGQFILFVVHSLLNLVEFGNQPL